MTRTTGTAVALILAAAVAAACEGPGSEGRTPATDQGPAARSAAAESAARQAGSEAAGQRGALPNLFAIMLSLQADMERVSRGIWAEAYDTIAAGAQAVADHPKVPPEELAAVAEALGPDLPRFKALDTRVHDLSVELTEAAEAGDMETVLARDAAIRQGCVECHTAFRERLRSALP